MHRQVNIAIQLCIVLAKTTFGTELPLCNSELDIQHDQCCLVKCMNATIYNNTECNKECPSHMFEIDSNYCKISTAFTCITNCPDGHYGLKVNGTNVCLDCMILCQVPYFKTLCSCKNQYSDTNHCADNDILIVIIGVLSAILVIVFVSAILGFFYQRRKDDKKGIKHLTQQDNGSQPSDKALVEEVILVANKHENDPRYTKMRFGTNPVQSPNETTIPNRRESNGYVNAEIIREQKKTIKDRISKTFNLMRKSTDCDKISTQKVENICSENNNAKTNKIFSRSKTVSKSNEHASTSHFSAKRNIECKGQNTLTYCNTTNGQDMKIGSTTMQLLSTQTPDIHENEAKEHKETLDKMNDNITSPYENVSSTARCQEGTVINKQGRRLSIGSISSKSSSSNDRRSTASDQSSLYYSASESLPTENKETVLHKIEESSDYANVISGVLNINKENDAMSEFKSFEKSNTNIGVTHMSGLNISSKKVTVNIINNK